MVQADHQQLAPSQFFPGPSGAAPRTPEAPPGQATIPIANHAGTLPLVDVGARVVVNCRRERHTPIALLLGLVWFSLLPVQVPAFLPFLPARVRMGNLRFV